MPNELLHHVVVQIDSARWQVLIANYNDKYYAVLCTCTDFEDAEYIANELNKTWYAINPTPTT